MSDALDYLIKARPETMSLYFAFLKKTGSKLDPKTRNLISVITKVHAQTERGLKQYLKRALKEGCSGEEVIDALLMAFPALGLAKIVWATDIILSMNLPEFQLAGETPPVAAPAEQWHDLLADGEVEPGTTRRLDCDGRGVFVYRDKSGQGYRVYDSLCPHQTTNIPHLALDGTKLTCPKHKWVFDLTTGACIAIGDTPLKQWPSRIEDGRLQAFW
jgi:nitrite reductase/ring-hydroxylating ferredoxin subunit/alkylhydroperoxidase/carboxymuconolactone decarboxylase family protein YurZ